MKYIKLYAYLEHNLGDDLMVDILLKRYAQYKFFYVDRWREYSVFNSCDNFITPDKVWKKWGRINHLCNILTLNKKKDFFIRMIKRGIERKSICSVYIGGSIYIEEANEKTESRILEESRKLIDGPLFIIGANFGPYRDQKFKESFHSYFEKCYDVCFRDRKSFDLFSDLPNVRYAPDVVFNFPNIAKKKSNNHAIISVIDFNSRSSLKEYASVYETFICDFCKACVLQELNPILVSFCKNEGDEDAIARIVNKFPMNFKAKIEVFMYNDIQSMVEKISTAKFVLATRFHAMILAIRFGIPFFCIAYNNKISNVLDEMNCDAYCLPEETYCLDAAEILEHSKLCIDCNNFVAEAEKQFEKLDMFLKVEEVNHVGNQYNCTCL